MSKNQKINLIITVLFSLYSFSQKKTIQTQFTNDKITVDGKFDEQIWKSAAVANNFVMFNPDNGKPENPNQKTEVRLVYTNEAIYVAAELFDNEPNKILKEISPRDDTGTADFFGVFINGFNDGQQDYRFYVTAAGVQLDCLYTESNGEDFTLNSISGTIKSDFNFPDESKNKFVGTKINFQTHGGGSEIKLYTVSGNISVRKGK